MKYGQYTLEQIFTIMNREKYWSIKGGLFNRELASYKDGKPFNEVIESLQDEIPYQEITIKAGDIDKNGEIVRNSPVLRFVVPAKTDDQETIYLDLNQSQSNQQNQTNGQAFLHGTNQTKGSYEETQRMINEAVTKATTEMQIEFKQQMFEYQMQQRLKELEEKEKRLSDYNAELIELAKDLETAKNKYLPDLADIGKEILSGFIGSIKQKKEAETTETPEEKEETGNGFNFDIEEEETTEQEPENKTENGESNN